MTPRWETSMRTLQRKAKAAIAATGLAFLAAGFGVAVSATTGEPQAAIAIDRATLALLLAFAGPIGVAAVAAYRLQALETIKRDHEDRIRRMHDDIADNRSGIRAFLEGQRRQEELLKEIRQRCMNAACEDER